MRTSKVIILVLLALIVGWLFFTSSYLLGFEIVLLEISPLLIVMLLIFFSIKEKPDKTKAKK